MGVVIYHKLETEGKMGKGEKGETGEEKLPSTAYTYRYRMPASSFTPYSRLDRLMIQARCPALRGRE